MWENQKSAEAKTKALVPIGYYILVIAFLYSLVCVGPGWKPKLLVSTENFHFLQLRKNLHIACACFRYGDNFSYIRIRF